MSFATGSELMSQAATGGYAIGAFNTNNLEITMSIVRAAVAEESPVILAASPGALKYAGARNIAAIAGAASEEARVPICLHLDHGLTLDDVRASLDAGFSSVMIDASALPFEDNIELTGLAVGLAHGRGVSVEAELGRLVGKEDQQDVSDREASMTDPAQAEEFCVRTGIDALAVSIGNAHGWYRGEPKLDLARLRSIRSSVAIPLVLHGASGISDETILQVCDIGIDKINIDTELRHAFKEAVAGFMRAHPDEIDPRKILGAAGEAMQRVVQKKMRLFGSAGKAATAGSEKVKGMQA